MKTEETIMERKQRDNKKGDFEQIKAELIKDVVSYVKSGGTVEYKRHVQELFWKYRKEGLDSKEAWEKAKRFLSQG